MRRFIVLAASLWLCAPVVAQPGSDQVAVQAMIVETYVEGLHMNRDLDAVRRGFHPDFVMHVFDGGQLIQAPLDMWLERLQLDGTKNPEQINHRFDWIDVTGNSAAVKMQIHEGGKHIYTDYFGLNRFDDGWKIVNKIFYGHD